MKSRILFAAMWAVFTVGAPAQTPQVGERTVINISLNNRVNYVFTWGQANQLYNELAKAVNPRSPGSWYMPRALSNLLDRLYNQPDWEIGPTPSLPPGWNPNRSFAPKQAVMAQAFYKDLASGKPMVVVYPIMVMLQLKEENLRQPDPSFKNEFAIYLAREGMMLDGWRDKLSADQLMSRRLDAWVRADYEVVRPLLAAGQPVGWTFRQADELLKGCGYKLPCPQFESFAGRNVIR